jgi:hypothetical protein
MMHVKILTEQNAHIYLHLESPVFNFVQCSSACSDDI